MILFQTRKWLPREPEREASQISCFRGSPLASADDFTTVTIIWRYRDGFKASTGQVEPFSFCSTVNPSLGLCFPNTTMPTTRNSMRHVPPTPPPPPPSSRFFLRSVNAAQFIRFSPSCSFLHIPVLTRLSPAVCILLGPCRTSRLSGGNCAHRHPD